MHPGGNAHPPNELSRLDRLIVIATGDDESDDQARFLVGAQQGQVFRSPHLHRDRTKRIDDGGPQRHERQRRRELGFEDLFFTLVTSHATSAAARGKGPGKLTR